ncbi:Oxygen-regulated protein 1 [Varanus komodoensis]|nr:Oxygen-regulated protein 1 [Varanus komodoensis]
MFSASSYKGYSNDNNSDSSYIADNDAGLAENHSHTGEPVDDIEKSVHLNQDGSMTVEMRVRFSIKEEETIKWTTSVSRAGISAVTAEGQSSEILPCKVPTEHINGVESNASLQQIDTEVTDQDSAGRTETSNYDIWQNPAMNMDLGQANNDNVKPRFHRPPTPGPRRVRQKKALVGSVTVVSDTAVQKRMVGQYSYSEEMGHGETKSEYCVVTHASSTISNVTNPTLSEECSSHVLKQLQDDQIEEDTLNKQAIQSSTELLGREGTFQNALEKPVVEEGLYNSLTSGCDSGTSHTQSYLEKCHASRQPLPKPRGTIEEEQSCFNNNSELSQSNSEEMISNQCRVLHSSQASVHCSLPESNKTGCNYVQMNPAVTGSSSIMTKNGSAECITASHPSDGSQAASSISKKKKKKRKKKSSSDTTKQGIGSQQNLHDISINGTTESEVKTCEMQITRDSTQHSSTQITVHKRVVAFPVSNSDGSNKSISGKEDFYSEFSAKPQQDELVSLPKKLNKKLPKLKAKSEKRHNLSPTTENEKAVVLVKDHSKFEIEQIKECTCNITTGTEQCPTHLASLRPLVKAGLTDTETEKLHSDKSHKSSMKNKKAKNNRKTENPQGSKGKVLDEIKVLDALKHKNFTDKITEHSLENYVQSWLQNVFPNEKHIIPINSNDRKMCQLSANSFPDKESQLIENNVYLTGKNNISESKELNCTLSHFSETQTVEESAKELCERHIGCLTDADASLIEEATYLLQSEIRKNTTLSMCNIVHENNKRKVQIEVGNQSHSPEIAGQVNPQTVNHILGTDVQKDCISGLLLDELKSAIINTEKNNIGCTTKPCCLADICSSLLESSSNLLLAWFFLLNLKESLFKDDIVQSTCSCSEIFTLLQYLKHIAIKEKAEDLKTAVCNLQDCTANCLKSSGMQEDKQEAPYRPENISLAETKNIPDIEEQGSTDKNVMLTSVFDSEEVVAAKDSSEKLERSSEEQKNYNKVEENSNMNDLDVHDVLQNLECAKAQLDNWGLTSNEELPKENGNSSLQESQEKATNTLFNNEESGLSEEPNSTIHSISSHDKDHIFDLETSELDDKELERTEQESAEPLQKKKNSNKYHSSVSDNATNCDWLESSIQEDLEEDGICEETSELLSTPSQLSFCYESKPIIADAAEEEPTSRVKLIVKELESGSHSNSSLEFKKCLKSPATSDLSDYRPESDESDYNFRPSSDLTNESTDETIYEKEYNKGYVRRTIERLYGKEEASFKPPPKPVSPYFTQLQQGDIKESFHTVREEAPLFCQPYNIWSDDKIISSCISQGIPENLNTSSDTWEKENATCPAPQFNPIGKEAYHNSKCFVEDTNQHNQPRAPTAGDDGVLIDKGKWLLKENHLIRKSPPENIGMYGNTDTTSTDTAFDNYSDDIPYSHFGNLDVQPPLKEISSSELEEMAKPCDHGCSYFNMPHNSDSEPFPDALRSKNSQHGSTRLLETTGKACITSPQFDAEVSSNSPSFTSVEFRLPDNKVHPLEELPDDEPIQTQPDSNANSNRNTHEDQDSLDKLHAICGQHCPILTAIIKPTNEEIRGCAYRKASDVENQVGLMNLLTNTSYFSWQSQDVIGFDKSHSQLKSSCINKIANNIFDRLYADNTLDFINGNKFLLLLSVKGNQDFKKECVTENMDVNVWKINNHENKDNRETLDEIIVGQHSNLPTFQSLRGSVNQTVGEKTVPTFGVAREGCNSEDFDHQTTFFNNIDWKGRVNLEDESAFSNKEKTLSYVTEEESDNEPSDS